MIDTRALLLVLADGECHSGEMIAQHFGVSRTAVWKHLERLKNLGLDVSSLRGAGYRLPNRLDLLDVDVVRMGLEALSPRPFCIESHLQIESTNDRMMAMRSAQSLDEFGLCLAESQTKGRGRRGRAWVSPFGSNIYLSLGFWWQKPVSSLQGLSLMVGVSITRVLGEIGVTDIGLKWPNDVVHPQGKLAGVLVELHGDVEREAYVVVGVGLNVSMSKADGVSVDQPWVALRDIFPCTVSRTELVIRLVSQIVLDLNIFAVHGFLPFHKRWASVDHFLGKDIKVLGRDVVGRGRGITEFGEYVLDCVGGAVVINAGEMSLREDVA